MGQEKMEVSKSDLIKLVGGQEKVEEKFILFITKEDEALIRLTLQLGAKVPIKTLLFLSYEGNEKVLQILYEEKVSFDVQGHNGWTPLMKAVFSGEEETVALILKTGVNVNAKQEKRKITALMLAATFNYMDIAVSLCDAGANLDDVDHRGYTAREIALIHGYRKMAEMLEKRENG